ncbi:prepilin-type N-terminal cleavage/methylation domain-containing protein [Kineococcus aurantiacus]|uniref:Prepilin-type N-terminal cleavage/methylation domain-containing protein n=1 Tax=Kineococcus aurantiacus TaxID=37633 RepID=A0A7Y9AS86_9ACTN|nr:prepilin-type N-terminal cleavage/methylation domain-containing protein [Kineococcus aurantiacus]NYD20821.1 prepilin-type N-terminal cleavage/methylation domain-containing protein [Kineococcus aurantiacus]
MTSLPPEDRHDAGFSLVEVVVALMLLAAIAASTAAFFLRSSVAASEQQRNQAATALASQAMDAARAVRPDYLLAGRSQSAVTNQWNTSSAPLKTSTFPDWDSAAGPASVPALPLASTVQQQGETYSVSTLVGVCYRPAGNVANEQCTKASASNARSTVSGYVRVYRVVVEVSWTTGGSTRCKAGTCTYRADTLVDPSAELRWSVTPAPVVEPSTQGTTAQTGSSTAVTLRTLVDAGNTDQYSKVLVSSTQAGNGYFSLDGTPYNATTRFSGKELTFTPPLNTVGTYSVRWFVRNNDGQSSKTVTMTVPVAPVATADSFTAKLLTSTTTVDVLTNDKPNGGPSVYVEDPVRTAGNCTLTRVGTSNQFKVTTQNALQTCKWTYVLRGVGGDSYLKTDPTVLQVQVIA